MCGHAVMGVQGEREGAEHTALSVSVVEKISRGGETANPNCLGSVCEEVRYPVAECGTEAQSVQFFQQVSSGVFVLNAERK